MLSGLGRLDRLTMDNTILTLPDVMRQSSYNNMVVYSVLAYAEDSGALFAVPVFAAGLCASWVSYITVPRMPATDDLVLHTSVNRILTCCAYGLASGLDGGGAHVQGLSPCAAPQGASLVRRESDRDPLDLFFPSSSPYA